MAPNALGKVQSVEEQVRAAAEHKLGVANQSITAGFFDNNTSAEDRREYLESLFRECKKEEHTPVLDDDALNYLIARSESEIDIFESVDKQRREEELATWRMLTSGHETNCSDPVSLLPSRLLTYEELKPFYEAMKISEVPKPGLVSNAGIKRKSENLGGLDTQQYGRGKRAREVRNYEEQWSEEEFEKMCQVDSPGSPKVKEEVMEKSLPTVVSGSIMAIGETEAPAPAPIKLPQQPSVEPPTQQSKEVTPPSKRGRGRPKRVTTVVTPSPMVLPVPSGASNVDVVKVSSSPTVSSPDSLSTSSTVKSITGTIHQFGVFIPPSCQSISPLSSMVPVSQSIAIPCPSPSVQVKGRGRKTQSGAEMPRRRGKKQSTTPPTVPVLPAPAGTGTELGSQRGVVSSSSSASAPDSVSASPTVKDISKVAEPISPIVLVPPAPSGTSKIDIGSQRGPVFCSPVVSAASAMTGICGTVDALGLGNASSSKPIPPLPSVAHGAQSILPSHSVPEQVEIQGSKGQSRVVAPSRRGKRQDPVTPVIPPDVLSNQHPQSNEPPQKKSRVSGVRKAITTRSMRDNEAQKLTNVIHAQLCEAPNPDGLAGENSNLTEKSDISVHNTQQTSTSATNNVASWSQEKKSAYSENRVDASLEIKNGKISTENEASQSLADLTVEQVHAADAKVFTPGINKVSHETPSTEPKIDGVLGSSGEDAPALTASNNTFIEVTVKQNLDDKTSLASSTSGRTPVCDFPVEKCGGHFEKEGGGNAEEEKTHVMGKSVAPKPVVCEPESKETDKEHCHDKCGENIEAQKLTDIAQVQACQVHISDGFTGPDSKSIKQSDYSLQNKQETNPLAAIDFAFMSLGKKSTHVEVQEVDATTKSQDRILSTEIETSQSCVEVVSEQTADIKDAAAVIKEVPCETSSSEAVIDESSRSEGGDAPNFPVSSDTLIEVTVNQSLNNKADPSLSTLGSNPVCDLLMCQSQSEMEDGERVEDEKNSVMGGPIAPKPNLSRSEGQTTDKSQCNEEKNPVMDESVGPKPQFSESEGQRTDKSHCNEKGGEDEAEKLEDIVQAQACEVHAPAGSARQDSKSSELSDYHAQCRQEATSGAVTDAAAISLIEEPAYLEVQVNAPVISKDGNLSTESEVSQTCEDLATEQSNTGDLTPAITEAPCEAPLSETKINESLTTEGRVVQAVPLPSNTTIEVTANQSSDNEIHSGLSTSEMAPVCVLPVEKCESQSGKEGARVLPNIVLDKSGSPKPDICELESERKDVVSVLDIDDSKQLIDESIGCGSDTARDVPISSKSLIEVMEPKCSTLSTSETGSSF
ncbi:unnamed protein product [Ilex paraguariensis]|uniref:Snf2 ATP coupling domain-containing protein n=1 Tax=Ilex paraguariensis TaxID=185542 RepID=A0ABC8TQ39_9AQUA